MSESSFAAFSDDHSLASL